MVCQDSKVHNSPGSLFFLFIFLFCWLSQGLVIWPRIGDPIVSQNSREICVSHSPGQILGCAHTIWSYRQISIFFLQFSVNHFPTQSCLVLCSFCANFLHSLIVWVIVSSLSPHNLHLLFCCVLSILAFYKWQQDTSVIQDSTVNSSWSQQWCALNDFTSSSALQFP